MNMFNDKLNIMKRSLSLLALVCFIAVMAMFQGCKKTTLPEMVTAEVSGVTLNTATSGGEITSDGGDDILEKVFVGIQPVILQQQIQKPVTEQELRVSQAIFQVCRRAQFIMSALMPPIVLEQHTANNSCSALRSMMWTAISIILFL